MNLFDQYHLSTAVEEGQLKIHAEETASNILAAFLEVWDDPADLEYLVKNSAAVLSGELPGGEFGADVAGMVYMKKEMTEIKDSHLGHDPISLPSTDFQQLVQQWDRTVKAFHEQVEQQLSNLSMEALFPDTATWKREDTLFDEIKLQVPALTKMRNYSLLKTLADQGVLEEKVENINMWDHYFFRRKS